MPQKAPFGAKSPLKLKIRSTLKVRIEGNIENGNCYCIRIDYDDNNEEVEEKEEEEEEEEKDKEEEEEQIGISYAFMGWLSQVFVKYTPSSSKQGCKVCY